MRAGTHCRARASAAERSTAGTVARVSLLHAFILGIVQGLTEFLPISSSGHLTLVPFIIGWDEPTLAFGVAVHLGTLVAVVALFREEVALVVRTIVGWSAAGDASKTLVRLLAVGTIPAVIVGVALEGPIGDVFERPVLVSILLGVTGYWLLSTETFAEKRQEGARTGDQMGDRDALGMGIAQAVAILPGISRSGATIGAGMRLGLSRAAATRFAFLLAIPIILGAGLAQLPDLLDEGLSGSGPAFLVGMATSALAGWWAIRWFLGIVERRTLRGFGTYLILAMVAGLVTALARG